MVHVCDSISNMKDAKIVTIDSAPAIIIDVRSPEEYQHGYIEGSINIPLQDIAGYIAHIKTQVEDVKDLDQKESQESQRSQGRPSVYVCCASGGRSAMAVQILKQAGIHSVENGGAWQDLECRCNCEK